MQLNINELGVGVMRTRRNIREDVTTKYFSASLNIFADYCSQAAYKEKQYLISKSSTTLP